MDVGILILQNSFLVCQILKVSYVNASYKLPVECTSSAKINIKYEVKSTVSLYNFEMEEVGIVGIRSTQLKVRSTQLK